jgi:hypothetical protein
MEKKGRNAEKFSDGKWITDLAFLMGVIGHLNKLNKELKGKDKIITDMNDMLLRTEILSLSKQCQASSQSIQ